MHQRFRQNQLHSQDADSFITDSTDNQRDSRVTSRVDLVDTSLCLDRKSRRRTAPFRHPRTHGLCRDSSTTNHHDTPRHRLGHTSALIFWTSSRSLPGWISEPRASPTVRSSSGLGLDGLKSRADSTLPRAVELLIAPSILLDRKP